MREKSARLCGMRYKICGVQYITHRGFTQYSRFCANSATFLFWVQADSSSVKLQMPELGFRLQPKSFLPLFTMSGNAPELECQWYLDMSVKYTGFRATQLNRASAHPNEGLRHLSCQFVVFPSYCSLNIM